MRGTPRHLEELIRRYPALSPVRDAISAAADAVIDTLERGGTLFVAGNGGSGSDAEHIAGELLKGFLLKRELPAAERQGFAAAYGDEGRQLADRLQRGLRCVSLLSHPGFLSAFGNDIDPELAYAQQLYALARPGDALLGISTSGNAGNVRKAFMTARRCGVRTILLTGGAPGRCVEFADLTVGVPERETYRIQELHLPVYHMLCSTAEDYFFSGARP